MLNHLLQLQVGLAGSQRDIIFVTLKGLGQLLLLTVWQSYSYRKRLSFPLTLKEYAVLNGNVLIDLHSVFEEYKP